MRGMLINDDKAVFGFGNDVGVCNLTACNAQRVAGAFGHGFVGDGGPAP